MMQRLEQSPIEIEDVNALMRSIRDVEATLPCRQMDGRRSRRKERFFSVEVHSGQQASFDARHHGQKGDPGVVARDASNVALDRQRERFWCSQRAIPKWKPEGARRRGAAHENVSVYGNVEMIEARDVVCSHQ